ncbi:hypothetical protein AGMMS49950_09780 [Endomicrobiia bacterium]|nr:hypothetical protein AGMMS49950_09780 [Endomicrobiia bacterium]
MTYKTLWRKQVVYKVRNFTRKRISAYQNFFYSFYFIRQDPCDSRPLA